MRVWAHFLVSRLLRVANAITAEIRASSDYLVPGAWIAGAVGVLQWLDPWHAIDAIARAPFWFWPSVLLLGIVVVANATVLIHRLTRLLGILPSALLEWLDRVGQFTVRASERIALMAVETPKHVAVAGAAALLAAAYPDVNRWIDRWLDLRELDHGVRAMAIATKADERAHAADLAWIERSLDSDRAIADLLARVNARIDTIRVRVDRPILIAGPTKPVRDRSALDLRPLEQLGKVALDFAARSSDRRECVTRFLAASELARRSRSPAHRVRDWFKAARPDYRRQLDEACGAIEEAARAQVLRDLEDAVRDTDSALTRSRPASAPAGVELSEHTEHNSKGN